MAPVFLAVELFRQRRGEFWRPRPGTATPRSRIRPRPAPRLSRFENADGGFEGPIQVVYRDDGSTPETGRRAVQELIDMEGVRVILGAIASPVTLAVAPMCEKN
ncbi:MAG: ABC transporter substrate-binding protein, partial [Akkermansiaceae bacterium]|nr:ABC transporter substrate-binding protein [Akkermansiaceae bacterium]